VRCADLGDPAQRILYGILAIAASIYSVVSVNLGGFILGMLFGVVGGSLAVAWVPDKFVPADIPVQRSYEPDDLDTAYQPVASAEDFFSRPDDSQLDDSRLARKPNTPQVTRRVSRVRGFPTPPTS